MLYTGTSAQKHKGRGITHKSCRAGTKHQNTRSETGPDLVETVASARGGLDQGRFDIAQVVDLEDLALGVGAVLGETAAESRSVTGPLVVSQKSNREVEDGEHLFLPRTFSQSRYSPRRQ